MNVHFHGRLVHNLIQFVLQSREFFRIQVSIHEGVPLSYCRPQGDNSDNGFGKREDNLEEKSKVSASIQLRRLPEILRDTVIKERSSYDDVIRYNGERNNHNPEGIQQMKSLYCQVGRDQTTALQEKQQLIDVMKYSLIIISSIPVLVMYPLVQKHFVKGVMIGSMKG